MLNTIEPLYPFALDKQCFPCTLIPRVPTATFAKIEENMILYKNINRKAQHIKVEKLLQKKIKSAQKTNFSFTWLWIHNLSSYKTGSL